ncbi:unnamed protein product [Rotaria sp. Silwood2]|nr:unnamed protein product [Rotaria sp. Silwood2]CAF2612056.1 unnamed protein product [Rotaria sp. Silwood2]
MKAVLAIIFFACIAGSMAADARLQAFEGIIAQGQAMLTSILAQVQTQFVGLAQQALGQLQSLVSSLGGRFDFDFQNVLKPLLALLNGGANNVLQQLTGALAGLLTGRALPNIGAIFTEFYNQVAPAITGLGQHFLNQGLSAVLGALGSLGGARAIGDLFAGLSQQFSNMLQTAQGAVSGIVGSLQTIGSNLLDASKPHWEQLQEQLVGHGLNVLGSLSETINNLHGSITGGR